MRHVTAVGRMLTDVGALLQHDLHIGAGNQYLQSPFHVLPHGLAFQVVPAGTSLDVVRECCDSWCVCPNSGRHARQAVCAEGSRSSAANAAAQVAAEPHAVAFTAGSRV